MPSPQKLSLGHTSLMKQGIQKAFAKLFRIFLKAFKALFSGLAAKPADKACA